MIPPSTILVRFWLNSEAGTMSLNWLMIRATGSPRSFPAATVERRESETTTSGPKDFICSISALICLASVTRVETPRFKTVALRSIRPVESDIRLIAGLLTTGNPCLLTNSTASR